MADLAGSLHTALADTDGNKCLVTDVFRPQKRYVRAVVTRGTANAVIDGVIALPATEAALHGSGLRYESGSERDNIGFWLNPEEWASNQPSRLSDLKSPTKGSVA
jgi:hypothetical protein